jgi:hypothetical protein
LLSLPAAQTHEIPRGAPLSTPGGHQVAVAADMIGIAPPAVDGACFEAKLAMWRLDDRVSGSQTVRPFKLCTSAKLVGTPGIDPRPPSP